MSDLFYTGSTYKGGDFTKVFEEALKDGFQFVKELPDPIQAQQLKSEGIDIEYGYWSYSFGDKKEFEICLEPTYGTEGMFVISIYKNRILLTERLPMAAITKDMLDRI